MENFKKGLAHLPTMVHLSFVLMAIMLTIVLIGLNDPAIAYAEPIPVLNNEDMQEVITIDLVSVQNAAPPQKSRGVDTMPEVKTGIAKESVLMALPTVNTSAKTYMDYKTITAKNSTQWKLQRNAITDQYGIRELDGRYMIALGTYYSDHAGALFHITLKNGTEFDAITGDIKADVDTDAVHQHRNGNVIEFIVDSKALAKDVRLMGDVSYAPGAGLMGAIASIEYQGEYKL